MAGGKARGPPGQRRLDTPTYNRPFPPHCLLHYITCIPWQWPYILYIAPYFFLCHNYIALYFPHFVLYDSNSMASMGFLGLFCIASQEFLVFLIFECTLGWFTCKGVFRTIHIPIRHSIGHCNGQPLLQITSNGNSESMYMYIFGLSSILGLYFYSTSPISSPIFWYEQACHEPLVLWCFPVA